MRWRWLTCCWLVLPLAAQISLGNLPSGISGPRMPASRPVGPRAPFRGGFGPYLPWGGGYGVPSTVVIEKSAPAPPAPILVNSNLYQPDKAQPAMREYSALPPPASSVAPASTPATAPAPALIAFRDGRLEPVQAYWLDGANLAYVTLNDAVRKVLRSSVDEARSEALNRQQGVEFRLRSTSVR